MEDLTGKKFGRLIVVSKCDYRKNEQIMWHCKCDCGNETDVRSHSLRCGETQSCGCLFEERRKAGQSAGGKTHFENLVGQRFGRLTVVQYLGHKKDNHKYLCSCDCGNTKIVWASSLRSGFTRSCGCYNREQVSKRHFKDLTGQVFGNWTVLERAENKVTSGGNPILRYLCECVCGTRKIVPRTALTSGDSKSCGCIGNSNIEYNVHKLLKNLNISFTQEHIFQELVGPGGGCLRFDFAFFDNKNKLVALLECQGKQHYINNNGFFGKLQRNCTDEMKIDYCKTHNIPLYEIRFDENVEERLDQIIKAIYDNTVPSERCSKV